MEKRRVGVVPVTTPEQLSVAKSNGRETAAEQSLVTVAGNAFGTGAMLSKTVTVVRAVETLSLVSVTVRVTMFAPRLPQLNEPLLIVIDLRSGVLSS